MLAEFVNSITRMTVIGALASTIFGVLIKLVLIVGLEILAGVGWVAALMTIPALFTSGLLLFLIVALIVFLLNKKWLSK